jgi:hypothetical protein
MTDKFKQAKNALEIILDREWKLRGDAPNEYFEQLRNRYPDDSDEELRQLMSVSGDRYFLRKEIPELITRGNHQVVLSLGYGYIGKTRIKGETSAHYVHTSLFVYGPQVVETIDILRELGFNVPEHHYVEIEQISEEFKVGDCGLSFVIARDLTEDGRYRVENVKDEHFETLSNGPELRRQLNYASRTLQEIYDNKNPLYAMDINDHVTDEGPQEAFKHMFFTQTDPNTNTGKLILGDLDHVILYRKPQAPSK